MYHILSSNIQTLKSRTLQSKDSEISVAVLLSDIEKGVENPVYYAYRYGMVYNPHEDFKPNVAGNHAIKGQLVDDYWNQLPEAREQYRHLLANFKNTNSPQIEDLKNMISQQRNTIQEQAQKIVDLRTQQAPSANNGQADRMESLIELQVGLVRQINEMKPKEITVNYNGSKNTVQADVLHEKYEMVLKIVGAGHPVFLSGPAGTGKSKLAEQVAQGLGLDFYSESAIFQEFKLTGFLDMKNDYEETAFYKAFKYGGVFMIDEIDASAPEILVILNTAIAQGYFTFPNEFVRAHENFRIISAGNTVGTGADNQYTGRQQLDASTLDRFFIIKIDYSEAIELAIANNDKDLVEFARSIRDSAETNGISILFSYRSIGRIASMQEDFDLVELLEIALLKGMAKDDVRILSRNMNILSTNKYFKALKKAA
jgi:cobaltochelatase CobS